MRTYRMIFIFLLSFLSISASAEAYTTYYDCGSCPEMTYDQMNTALDALCTANPSWVRTTFGQSAEGRTINGIIINGSSYSHTILLTAGIHGNEKGAQRALLDWLNYLSANPTLYRYTRFIVVSIANPDGQVRTQGKNHNSAVSPLREVNLNRNFDPGWATGDGSTDPDSGLYKGPYVESEPESQVLMGIITAYHPDTHFDVHQPDSVFYTEQGISLTMYNLINAAVQVDGFDAISSSVIAQDGMLFNYSRSQGVDSYVYETTNILTNADQLRESNKFISAMRSVVASWPNTPPVTSGVVGVNKFIIAFKETLSSEDVTFIANHYQLVDTYLNKAAQITTMKGINPNLKAIYYHDAIGGYSGAQAWYVLDADGDQIEHNTQGWRLADIGNASYRTYLAQLIKSNLDSNTMFDGVMLDDVWTGTQATNYKNDFYKYGTTTPTSIPTSYLTNWSTNMALLITEIKAAIGPDKLLIINTAYGETTLHTIADGYVDEAFGHAEQDTYPNYVTDWKARVDAMVTWSRKGKIVLAVGGVKSDTSLANTVQAGKYCYALFLAGQYSTATNSQWGKTPYFYFTNSYDAVYWDTNWDLNVGVSSIGYTQVSSDVIAKRYNTSYVSADSSTHIGSIYLINDFTVYPQPAIIEPTKGGSFIDPQFSTTVTKVVDAVSDFSSTNYVTYHGWTRHDAESPDHTKWTMQSAQYPAYHVFNATAPYAKIQDLPAFIFDHGPDPDYRWPHNSSSYLYATWSAKFGTYTLGDANPVVIHDFTSELQAVDPTIWRITGKESGNPSTDDRYWAWSALGGSGGGQDMAIVVYDKTNNTSTIQTYTGSSIAFIGMSPSGNYVIVDTKYDSGIQIYTRDLTDSWNIPINVPYSPVSGIHAFPGVGYDDLGNEVIVWVEPKPNITPTEYWVYMQEIKKDGVKTALRYFGSVGNFNASAVFFESKPGWALINGSQLMDGTSWSDNEIFIIRLTKNANPPVWRVAKTHTYKFNNEHTDDQFAKPNRTGTKVFFRSNWGISTLTGGKSSAYQIDLPTGWDTWLNPSVFAYKINDETFYTPPGSPIPWMCTGVSSPYSWCTGAGTPTKPPKGVPFTDPTFGVTITRITDAVTDFGGPSTTGAWPGYVHHNIENIDSTKLLIQNYASGRSGWSIIDATTPFSFDQDIEYQSGVTGYPIDARWSKTSPYILYYEYGSKYWSWDIRTQTKTLVHDFQPDFPTHTIDKIDLSEEGDGDDQGRYMIFSIKSYDTPLPIRVSDGQTCSSPWEWGYVVYDQIDNIIIASRFAPEGYCLGSNWRSMSASGKYAIHGSPPLYVQPRDLSTPEVEYDDFIGAHMGFGVDKTGKDVLVGIANRGEGYGYWTKMIDIETGERFWLAPFPLDAQIHVAAQGYGQRGWMLISVYSPNSSDNSADNFHSLTVGRTYKITTYVSGDDFTNVGASSNTVGVTFVATGTTPANWGAPGSILSIPESQWGDHEAYMVELSRDGNAKNWRVAHTPSYYMGYGSNPFAKPNRQGTKIFFQSSWVPAWKPVDAYQIDLPSTWWQDLYTAVGAVSTPAPIISNPLPIGIQACGAGPNKSVTIQIDATEASGVSGCKYDTVNTPEKAYADMTGTFGSVIGSTYSQQVSLPCGSSYLYYTKCITSGGTANLTSPSNAQISFSIELPGGVGSRIGYYPSVPPAYGESAVEIVGNKYTATETGVANPGTFYAYVSNPVGGTTHAVCGVYADNGGTYQGATKLSSSPDAVLNVVGTGWVGSSITVPSGFVSGTNYWLVCSIDSSTRIYYDTLGTTYWNYYPYSGTLPSTGPAVSPSANYTYGMYVSYGTEQPRIYPSIFGISSGGGAFR